MILFELWENIYVRYPKSKEKNIFYSESNYSTNSKVSRPKTRHDWDG